MSDSTLFVIVVIVVILIVAALMPKHKGPAKENEDEFMKAWQKAAQRKDIDECKKLLQKEMSSCQLRSTRCGSELFCPDCPVHCPVYRK